MKESTKKYSVNETYVAKLIKRCDTDGNLMENFVGYVQGPTERIAQRRAQEFISGAIRVSSRMGLNLKRTDFKILDTDAPLAVSQDDTI